MKNYLNDIFIDNFRGLYKCNLEDLGNINLLVGFNNSGKTSLLEAINIYGSPCTISEWMSTSRRREIKSSRTSVLESLNWLFPKLINSSNNSKIKISSKGNYNVNHFIAEFTEKSRYEINEPIELTYQQEYDGLNLSDFGYYEENNEPVLVKGCQVDVCIEHSNKDIFWNNIDNSQYKHDFSFEIWENEKAQWSQKQSPFGFPVSFISPFSHRIEQLQIKALTDSTLLGFKKDVVDILKTLDSGIVDIDILAQDGMSPSIFIDHISTGITPLSMFGDGVRKALTFALSFPILENGVLLLDEIETSLHTSALTDLFEWICKFAKDFNIQVFATTHSLEAVDSILISHFEKTLNSSLVLYHLDKNNQKTKIKRYDEDLLYRMRFNRGLDIR